MNYFIIGDIHGCYNTLINMLSHWNHDEEYLILVGDLIDRGNFNSLVLRKCRELETFYEHFIVLKGNHEAELIEYIEKGCNNNWLQQVGIKTLEDFSNNDIQLNDFYEWLKNRPIKFEKEAFLITHAGISNTKFPYKEDNENGVLWNRKDIKNIGKLQIHGHTPLLSPIPYYNKKSNSWNIDTGAFYGYGLTGLKIDGKGKLLKLVNETTQKEDVL